MIEKWKAIKGYDGIYEVSNFGRVKRILGGMGAKPGRILRPNQNVNKYLSVSLSKNGIVKVHRIHRLVAEAFIKKDQSRPIVNHLDGDRTNNHVDNLTWSTISENHIHAYACLNRQPTRPMAGKFGKDHNRSKPFRLIFPSGEEKIYEGGLEARRELGIDNTSISYGLKQRNGYKFKRGKLKGFVVKEI